MSKLRGFTLIEVMIVVGIVAILSAVAMPAYTDYITRGKLTEARAALDSQRVKMEQFFQDNRTYVGACASALANEANADTKNWNISCPVEAAGGYTLQADPTADGPAGFQFQYISAGNIRATTGVPSGWTANANCWVVKKGGVC